MEAFDRVVLGAGTAGEVTAGRLAERGAFELMFCLREAYGL